MDIFSFMPKDAERASSSLISVGTIFVPYWVQDFLDRKQIDYIDLLNYDKMRSALSVEDLSLLLKLNDSSFHNDLKDLRYDCNGLFSHWSKTCSTDNKDEYYNVVNTLSKTENIQNILMERLYIPDQGKIVVDTYFNEESLLKINGEDKEKLNFKITPLANETIFIFFKKGFINTLEVRDSRFKFISEYLKALYTVLPIREVSNYCVFNTYYNML